MTSLVFESGIEIPSLKVTGGGAPTPGQVLAADGSGFAVWQNPAPVADATTTSKGILRLAGDLAGTATAPTVPGLLLKEDSANKGVAGGYAPLDLNIKVPAAYLPSYVDDVEEYADLASFPIAGDIGKIYVAIDTGKIYRWSGTMYVEISPSPGSTDAVPEGALNLYFTDARAQTAVVIDSIADGDTTHAPSRNAVYDALLLKADDAATTTALNNKVDKAGDTMTGPLVLAGTSLQFSDGVNPVDTAINRVAPGVLETPGAWLAEAYLAVTPTSTDTAFAAQVTGDTMSRFYVDGTGQMAWGDGTGAQDVFLARIAPNTLALFPGDKLQQNTAPTVGADLTNMAYVDTLANSKVAKVGDSTTGTIAYTGANATSGFTTRVTGDTQDRVQVSNTGISFGPGNAVVDASFSRISASLLSSPSLRVTRATATACFQAFVTGDTNPRWQVMSDGQMSWGGGSGSVDAFLTRLSAGAVRFTTTAVQVTQNNATFGALQTLVTGDTAARINILANGEVRWGPGNAAADVVWARTGVGAFTITGAMRLDGNVGFYNTAPVAKPTVTGSRGNNAALASLLTALASQGLLTDGSVV